MATKKEAPKLSGLISTKGQATPSGGTESKETTTVKSAPQRAPVSRSIKAPSTEVATKKKTTTDDRIPITVKLEPEQYERMKIFGVRQRRTTQDIMVEALEALLEKAAR